MDFKKSSYYKQQNNFINLSKAKIDLYKALKTVFRFKIWQDFFQSKIEFHEMNIHLIEENLKMHEQAIEQVNEQIKVARQNMNNLFEDMKIVDVTPEDIVKNMKKITKDFSH